MLTASVMNGLKNSPGNLKPKDIESEMGFVDLKQDIEI